MNYFEYLNIELTNSNEQKKFKIDNTSTRKLKRNSVFNNKQSIKIDNNHVFEYANKDEVTKVDYDKILKDSDDEENLKLTPLEWILKKFLSLDDVKKAVDKNEDDEITAYEVKIYLENLIAKDGNADRLSLDDFQKVIDECNIKLEDIVSKEESTDENNPTVDNTTPETYSDTESSFENNIDENTVTNTISDSYDYSPTPQYDSTPVDYSSDITSDANQPTSNILSDTQLPDNIDTMSLEELNTLKEQKTGILTDAQNELKNANAGNTEAIQAAVQEENLARQNYEESLNETNLLLQPYIKKIKLNNIDIENLKNSKSEYENKIIDKKTEISNQEQVYNVAEARLESLKNTLSQFPENSDDPEIINKRNEINNAIAEQQKIVDAEKTKLENLKKELDGEVGLNAQLEYTKRQLEAAEYVKAELDNVVSELGTENQKKALEAYNAATQKTESIKKEEISAAQEKVNAAQEMIDTINEKIVAAEAHKVEAEYSNNEFFDPNMEISIEKVNDGNTMPYLLMGPKDVKPGEELPVIVYLHGIYQRGSNPDLLEKMEYDPAVIMKQWNLQNFRGYILCPQLPEKGSWCNENSRANVENLLDKVKETHNVDKNNISLMGFSYGGSGALYMAEHSKAFKKVVAISPYRTVSNVQVPTKVFAASAEGTPTNLVKGSLKTQLGEENCEIAPVDSHFKVPGYVYGSDKDNNGRSDILEWLVAE